MRPIVILAKLQIQYRDQEKVAQYYEQLDPKLKQVDGYEGVGLWQSPTEPNAFLALYHYTSVEAAERGLEVVAEERTLTQSIPAQFMPPDVTRIEVMGRLGRREPNAKVGDFLSISFRLSDPGYSDQLLEDLNQTFAEIMNIPGFLGAEWGQNESLCDEVIGIASWESQEAFQNSLPPGRQHELSLYMRVI